MQLLCAPCPLPGLGDLTVHTSIDGIAAVAFPGESSAESLLPWRQAGASVQARTSHFHRQFTAELATFAAGSCQRFRTAHDHRFIPGFLAEVLAALRTIPAGKTLTYGELADLAGRPRAARAVGMAMRRNPTPMLVPCHRVVASTGLGGFTPGLGLKKRLLGLEEIYRLATKR